jgi:cell division protein FtsN
MVSFGKGKDEKAGKKHRYDFDPVANDEIVDILLTEENHEVSEPPLAAALIEPENSQDEEFIYDLVVKENNLPSAQSEPVTEPELATKAEPEFESQPETEAELEFESQPEAEPEAEFEPETISEPEITDNRESTPEPQVTDELQLPHSLAEQVANLSREYETINKQLEKSLLATHELTQQLAQSKNLSASHYLAMGVTSLAFLIAFGAVVASVNMERDVSDLKSSLNGLIAQTAAEKKQLAAKNKEIDNQIAQLNGKVNSIFAADNLDNVLQVTQELKKQVNALANKNLAILSNSHNHLNNQTPKTDKAEKASLLALKSRDEGQPIAKKDSLATPALLAAKSPLPSNAEPEKTQPVKTESAKAEIDNKPSETPKTDKIKAEEKPETTKPTDTEASKPEHWALAFGTFRDKNLAQIAASKLKNSGVSVEVVEVKRKKIVFYRVVSKSFKSKKEARHHAAQVKKELGLYSAVVKKAK